MIRERSDELSDRGCRGQPRIDTDALSDRGRRGQRGSPQHEPGNRPSTIEKETTAKYAKTAKVPDRCTSDLCNLTSGSARA